MKKITKWLVGVLGLVAITKAFGIAAIVGLLITVLLVTVVGTVIAFKFGDTE